MILLYVLYNIVYSAGSLPLGGLSDRVGQYPPGSPATWCSPRCTRASPPRGPGWTLAALFAAYGPRHRRDRGHEQGVDRARHTDRRARLRTRSVLHRDRPRDVRREYGRAAAWSAWGPWATFAYGRGGRRRGRPPHARRSHGRVRGALAAGRTRTRRLSAERGPAEGRPSSHAATRSHAHGATPVAPYVERIRCATRPADHLGGRHGPDLPGGGRADDDDASFCQGCGAAIARALRARPSPPIPPPPGAGRPAQPPAEPLPPGAPPGDTRAPRWVVVLASRWSSRSSPAPRY